MLFTNRQIKATKNITSVCQGGNNLFVLTLDMEGFMNGLSETLCRTPSSEEFSSQVNGIFHSTNSSDKVGLFLILSIKEICCVKYIISYIIMNFPIKVF